MRPALLFLLCAAGFAQVRIPGPGGVSGSSGPVTYTSNLGGPSATGTDMGFSLFVGAVPYRTGANWSSIAFPNCNLKILNPQSGNVGCAIYSDSSGAPGTLICKVFSSTTPSSGINTFGLSGCGTPAANTLYWVAFAMTSNTQQIGTSSISSFCIEGRDTVFSNSTISQFNSNADWPSSFPANSPAGNGCYTAFVTATYQSTDAYNYVTLSQANTTSCTACAITIPPVVSGHGFIVGVVSPNGKTPTSVTVGSDTLTARGTCNTGGTTGSVETCIYSEDRATAGGSTVTVNFGSASEPQVTILEVAGTLASSSFDKSCYDTTEQATPFTGCATATTTQAAELWFGLAANTLTSSTFAATGPWSLPLQGTGEGGTGSSAATFLQQVASTGTCSVTGTYGTAGTSNFTACATFK